MTIKQRASDFILLVKLIIVLALVRVFSLAAVVAFGFIGMMSLLVVSWPPVRDSDYDDYH